MKQFVTSTMAIQLFALILISSGMIAASGVCNGPGEVGSDCGVPLDCQETCSSVASNCLTVCTSDCSCADGWVREYRNGPCIPKSECPYL